MDSKGNGAPKAIIGIIGTVLSFVVITACVRYAITALQTGVLGSWKVAFALVYALAMIIEIAVFTGIRRARRDG